MIQIPKPNFFIKRVQIVSFQALTNVRRWPSFVHGAID